MRRSLGVCVVSALLLVAVLLAAGTATAATVPTSKGDKAMVFQFHGLDALALSAYGGGFGMRYYLADDLALRGAVVFDKYSKTEEPESVADPDEPDCEFSSTEMGLHVVVEKHLEGCGPSVSPYLGVGGGFSKYSSEEKEADSWGVGEWGQDVTTEDSTRLSLYGVAGFEWAFTDCLTLGGEYVLGFWSGSGEEEVDFAEPGVDTWKDGKISESWMGFGTASVYLSVYW